MIRVLICDDTVAFATLIGLWIDECDDLKVVGVARTATEAREQAVDLEPDVIVIDHLLRETTSDELVPLLRREAPSAALLVVSGMPEDALAEIANASGADGCLSKSTAPADVCQSIRAVAGRRSS